MVAVALNSDRSAPALPRWAGLACALLATVVAGRVLWRFGAEPDAALSRAERAMQRGAVAVARQAAHDSLTAQPLDGRAWRVLARAAAMEGNDAASEQALQRALRYAPRDLQTRALVADRALERGDGAAAVPQLDALLRMEPPLGESLFPTLAQLAVATKARPTLIARLARHPPWRSEFLTYLIRESQDVGSLEPLMVGLQGQGGLADSETAAWLDRYVAERRWDDAYRVWLRLLPAARRQALSMPDNGDFERLGSGASPFEWTLSSIAGVDAAMLPLEDSRGHALRLTFAGTAQPYDGVRQLLLLTPGRSFTLRWRSRLESLDTPRGLRWELSCAGGDERELLHGTPERGSHPWQLQTLRFTIPADCPAQWLRLRLAARIASENQAVGAAWWDDVAILDADGATSG